MSEPTKSRNQREGGDPAPTHTLVERLYNDAPTASLSVEAGAEIQRLRAALDHAEAALYAGVADRAQQGCEASPRVSEKAPVIAWAVESNIGGGLRAITKLTTSEDEADRYANAVQASYAGCERKKIELCARAALQQTAPAAPTYLALQRLENPYNERDHGPGWQVAAHAWDEAIISAMRIVGASPVAAPAAPNEQQAHVLPPVAAPVSQHDASASVLPPLPAQLEELRAQWKCESCDGNGHTGEMIGQGWMQPPEPRLCPDCDGSGQFSVTAYVAEQMQEYGKACVEADRRGRAQGGNTNTDNGNFRASQAATTANAKLDQQIETLMSVPDEQIDDHMRSLGLDPAECEAAGRRALDGALNTIATTASTNKGDKA
jgi:hypothetical protein